EAFFLDDAQPRIDVLAHCWLAAITSVTQPRSAGQIAGSVLFALAHVAGDALQLFLRHQRSHLSIVCQAWPEFDLLCLLSHAFDDVVKDFPLNHQAGAGAATLAVIEKDGIGRASDSGFEIAHVFEDNIRGFAAEFEADFLEISSRSTDDDLADFG